RPSVPLQPEGELLMKTLHGTMSRLLVLASLFALVILAACGEQAPAPCQIPAAVTGPFAVRMIKTGAATANCPAERDEHWYFSNSTGGLLGMRSRKVPQPNPPDPNSTVYGKGHFANVDPDAQDLCNVPSLDRPFQGPGGTTYDVKNLAFLSTALYIG